MDLIYMDDSKNDIGVMRNFTLDLAYGADENDFELKTSTDNNVCKAGYYLYAEGTEYGGIIDTVNVKTASRTLIYHGRTWHGILGSKIIEPPSGQSYLILSGDANRVLETLISRMGLTALFAVVPENSGLVLRNYQFPRYIDGYTAIKKMLASIGGKLSITFKEGFAVLQALHLVDYSQNEEFDSSQIEFDIEKNYKPTNHVICLGSGNLTERTVIHLYADEQGNISKVQSLFGMSERTEIYENVNAESNEELEEGGIDLLKSAWNSDAIDIDFNTTNQTVYDIGDIVGARENITGIYISQAVIKKIITLKNDRVKISYKVGEK